MVDQDAINIALQRAEYNLGYCLLPCPFRYSLLVERRKGAVRGSFEHKDNGFHEGLAGDSQDRQQCRGV